MKKILLVISILIIICTLGACTKELEPINENQLADYLKGQDSFLSDNYLEGKYILTGSGDNVMYVDYNGENSLLKYKASYTVKSEVRNKKWSISSFVIDSSDTELKDVNDLVYELVEKTDEKITSGQVSGRFKMLEAQLNNNKLVFTMSFISDDGSHDVIFEGIVKDSNGALVLEEINSKAYEDDREQDNKPIYNSDQEKMIDGFYTDLGYTVESISEVTIEDNYLKARVKYSELWKYLKEVFEIDVTFKIDGDTLELIEEKVISDRIFSRIVGKYVNVSENGTTGYESYIIFNEDFSYTLYENNYSGFEKIEEYYLISDNSLTLQNRDLLLIGYTNNKEVYHFSIDSLEQITCNEDIISTRSGNVFKKVEE